jgi:hypothetical protein
MPVIHKSWAFLRMLTSGQFRLPAIYRNPSKIHPCCWSVLKFLAFVLRRIAHLRGLVADTA